MVNKVASYQKTLSTAKKCLSAYEATCAKVVQLIEFKKKLQNQVEEIDAKRVALKQAKNQAEEKKLKAAKHRHSISP
uniref:BLOC-1-related complex subunit 7 n=1 Tax=Panagrellus redivivus TaxID=6233 RepID=A0A7E4W684_PANRE